MARVTDQELREYVNDETGLTVSSYISDASALMDYYFSTTPVFGEVIAKLIEKNLAAHFYLLSVERGGIVQQKIGESSETYAKSTLGEGIGSTRFGQLALSLDPTGKLIALVNPTKRKAQFRIA